MTPERTSTPMLDLGTIAPKRKHIRIDGKPYELAVAADLGTLQKLQLTHFQAAYTRFQVEVNRVEVAVLANEANIAPIDAGVIREFEDFVATMTPLLVLGADRDIVDKLTHDDKLLVITAFMVGAGLIPMERFLEIKEMTPPSRPQTLESLSHDSNDSMGGLSPNG